MRYLIKIGYDGSKYNGFQRLNDLPSVQKEIEVALKKIFKEEVFIKGAGRTDQGVHAYAQMAHFDTNININPESLKSALNRLLNNYIHIYECKLVDEEFHARFSVKKKTYEYRINLGEFDPLLEDYMFQVKYDLDIALMKKASKIYLGIHDFENFVSGHRENYNAIIYNINFKKVKNILSIEFVGQSFYRYMVRSLVGALLDVGRGKISIDDLKKSLDKKTNKRFYIAPPGGLYLTDIKY